MHTDAQQSKYTQHYCEGLKASHTSADEGVGQAKAEKKIPHIQTGRHNILLPANTANPSHAHKGTLLDQTTHSVCASDTLLIKAIMILSWAVTHMINYIRSRQDTTNVL